jgi:hypothetical protein
MTISPNSVPFSHALLPHGHPQQGLALGSSLKSPSFSQALDDAPAPNGTEKDPPSSPVMLDSCARLPRKPAPKSGRQTRVLASLPAFTLFIHYITCLDLHSTLIPPTSLRRPSPLECLALWLWNPSYVPVVQCLFDTTFFYWPRFAHTDIIGRRFPPTAQTGLGLAHSPSVFRVFDSGKRE